MVFLITLGAGLAFFCISAGLSSSKAGSSVPSNSQLYRFKTAVVVSSADGNVCSEIGRYVCHSWLNFFLFTFLFRAVSHGVALSVQGHLRYDIFTLLLRAIIWVACSSFT